MNFLVKPTRLSAEQRFFKYLDRLWLTERSYMPNIQMSNNMITHCFNFSRFFLHENWKKSVTYLFVGINKKLDSFCSYVLSKKIIYSETVSKSQNNCMIGVLCLLYMYRNNSSKNNFLLNDAKIISWPIFCLEFSIFQHFHGSTGKFGNFSDFG